MTARRTARSWRAHLTRRGGWLSLTQPREMAAGAASSVAPRLASAMCSRPEPRCRFCLRALRVLVAVPSLTPLAWGTPGWLECLCCETTAPCAQSRVLALAPGMPAAVLDGVVQGECSPQPKEFIKSAPRGAYTSLLVRQGWQVVDWETHLQRLARSLRALDEALGGVYSRYYAWLEVGRCSMQRTRG